MAQLFIPQAPDLLGPAFNLQRLRQQGQQIEQQGEQHKALQQYRQDLIDERDLNAAIKLVSEGQHEAAKALIGGNQNLARKFGTASLVPNAKPMTMDQLRGMAVQELATDPETGQFATGMLPDALNRIGGSQGGLQDQVIRGLATGESGQLDL